MNIWKESKFNDNFTSDKNSWSNFLATALNLVIIFLFIYMLSTCWYSVSLPENFVALVCLGMLIYYFYMKSYIKQPIFKLALIFFLIFTVTEIVYCEFDFKNSYSYITRIAFSTCIAFPFFSNFEELTKKKLLKIIIIMSVSCVLIFSLISIYISIYTESELNHLLGSIIYINNLGRLCTSFWHTNILASLLGISFMLSLYMAFTKNKKIATVFWIFACVILYYTISLTGTRTVMFGVALCSSIVFSYYLIPMLYPVKNKALKTILIIAAIAIMILVLFLGFRQITKITNNILSDNSATKSTEISNNEEISENITANSSNSENKQIALRKLNLSTLLSLNNRVSVYKAGIITSASSVKSFLFGFPVGGYMPLVNKITSTKFNFSNMHNSFLQVLLETGIIGFIVAVCICIIIFIRCIKTLLNWNNEIEKKIIALIPIFILIQSMLEPSILSPVHYMIDVPFFLLSSYVFSSKI